jgi:FkbM family methyltransferase
MAKNQGGLAGRLRGAVSQRVNAWRLRRSLRVVPREDLVTLGSSTYGAWTFPAEALGKDSACYLAGLGEDATFDLALIERFGCAVHAFDPVPEAARFAADVAATEPRFHFQPVGLWSCDGTLRFYENAKPGYVSRSATNMHHTSAASEAPVRSVGSLMAELGDERVDLLKLSVEGSEYEILGDVLAKQLPVGVLCVEFAQPAPLAQIREQIRALEAADYELVRATLLPFNWKLTFAQT